MIQRTGATAGTGYPAAPSISAGTQTETLYNNFWKPYAETRKDIESSLTTTFWAGSDPDLYGRPQRIEYNGNSNDYSTSLHTCCGLASQRDRDGTTTTYSYDLLKREYRRIVKRSTTGVAIQTSTARAGLATTTSVSAGSIAFETSKTVTNLLGETTENWAADSNGDGNLEKTNIVTEYPSGGGLVVTETDPLLGTRITVSYRDGRTKRVHGTAVADMSYEYGVHDLLGGGLTTKKIRETSTGGTSEWTATYTDHLGRTIKTAYADGAENSLNYYDSSAAPGKRGQLASQKDPDEVAVPGKGSKVEYDYNSEGEQTTSTETIADNHTRTTLTARSVVQLSSGAGNDPAIPNDTYFKVQTKVNNVVTQTTHTSADGYESYTASLGRLTASIRSVPSDGAWTETSTTPGSQSQKLTHTDGLLEKTEFFDNLGTSVRIAYTTYAYDALGRMVTATDSRTGTSTYSGVSGTGYTPSGNLLGMKDAGNRPTTHTYDALGRRLTTTLPDTSVTRTRYTTRGEVEALWDSQTYPTFRTYDEQGRSATLHTWRDSISLDLSDGVSAAELAVSSTTTWAYHSQRGWLDNKRDAESKGADYTYTLAGRLKTRTWARIGTGGNRVTTTYAYDQGMLESITYANDPTGTPSVSLTYDSFGRSFTVAQGGNLHTYAYESTTFALDTETVAYDTDADGTADFTRVLDRHQDSLLRDSGWELKAGSTLENAVSYGYDSAGRLRHVDSAYPLPGSPAFTYGYVSGSYGLIDTVSGPAHIVNNNWEGDRDVLLDKINHLATPTNPVSKYNYAVTTATGDGANALGQRKNLATTGSGFDPSLSITTATGPAYAWGYNSRGELEEASDTSAANKDRAYQYDAIGNREKTIDGLLGDLPSTPNYAANALNQYTTANSVTLPTPAYDSDGNYTHGPLPVATGNATLIWDAENRLFQVTRADMTVITYSYDYLSRRISKKVGSATAERYVYDGWNPIAKYTGTTLVESYAWGMDLSGSMQGAGGVGGLLAVTDEAAAGDPAYFPTYDGNGNVSEYLNASGAIQAHYEYDPFGSTTVETGTKAADFSHRFSTKPLDSETGLYYYGYRYYDPLTGRWPSRDPIQERGGVNLYGFVVNDGMNLVDVNGLTAWATSWPQGWWDNNTGSGTPFAPTDSLPPGLGGLGPEVNQAAYYNDNFGDIIEGNISLLSNKINNAAKAACDDEPSSVDVEPELDAYPGGGNTISNIISMNLETGRATSSVDGLQITWWNLGTKKTFSWTAEMTLSDSLGYNPPGTGTMWNEDLMYGNLGSGGVGLFPYRQVIRGRWPISGDGECPCDPNALY